MKEHGRKPAGKLTQDQIDHLVAAKAEDDAAWEKAV
jgi:hypothetical protein